MRQSYPAGSALVTPPIFEINPFMEKGSSPFGDAKWNQSVTVFEQLDSSAVVLIVVIRALEGTWTAGSRSGVAGSNPAAPTNENQ